MDKRQPQKSFSTNDVGHAVVNGNQEHILISVYSDISRINHSCRPNAYLSWDPDRGVGTVPAPTKLDVGQEIFFHYIECPQECVQKGKDRRTELKAHWDFDYTCLVCKQAPLDPDDGGDDAVRIEALSLCDKI